MLETAKKISKFKPLERCRFSFEFTREQASLPGVRFKFRTVKLRPRTDSDTSPGVQSCFSASRNNMNQERFGAKLPGTLPGSPELAAGNSRLGAIAYMN